MNKTKILATRLVVLTALSLFAACALAQEAAPITSKLEEYLSAAAKKDFTGSALVARDGKVIFSKGYGMANAEWDVPNTPQTKFRLGSITKQFTAASILLLQERGKLGVQDPVCKYIAECPKAWEPITIHHLLTHTSGIPSYTDVKSPEEFRKLSLNQVTPRGLRGQFQGQAARISRRGKDEVQQLRVFHARLHHRESFRQKLRGVSSGEYLRAAENG